MAWRTIDWRRDENAFSNQRLPQSDIFSISTALMAAASTGPGDGFGYVRKLRFVDTFKR